MSTKSRPFSLFLYFLISSFHSCDVELTSVEKQFGPNIFCPLISLFILFVCFGVMFYKMGLNHITAQYYRLYVGSTLEKRHYTQCNRREMEMFTVCNYKCFEIWECKKCRTEKCFLRGDWMQLLTANWKQTGWESSFACFYHKALTSGLIFTSTCGSLPEG